MAFFPDGHRAQFLGSLGVEARFLSVRVRLEQEVVEYFDTPSYPAVVTRSGEIIEADVSTAFFLSFPMGSPTLPGQPPDSPGFSFSTGYFGGGRGQLDIEGAIGAQE